MIFEEMINKVIQGNAIDVLKQIPNERIDNVITSPPYWALRAYQTEPHVWDGNSNCEHEWSEYKTTLMHENRNNIIGTQEEATGQTKTAYIKKYDDKTAGFCSKCGAWLGELGLEPTFQLYIKHLCDIFDEIKRILKNTGTCFVNLGDTYASGGGASRHKGYTDPKYPNGRNGGFDEPNTNPQNGASEKSLCQIPSRFAIEMSNRGWILRNKIIWFKRNCMPASVKDRFTVDFEEFFFFVKEKKYWFETQYEPIKSINDSRVDKGRFEYNGKLKNRKDGTQNVMCGFNSQGRNKRCVWDITTKGFPDAHFAVFPEALIETPIKAGCPEGGLVLDLFGGSGTTGVVAKKLGRNFILIDLNEKYCEIARKRIANVPERLTKFLK